MFNLSFSLISPGHKYCREQTDPVYEAKGIETVRRDGCPAVAKILEKCLRKVFG